MTPPKQSKSIIWLHLSDLHLCEPKSGWDTHRVLEPLLKDLQHMEQEHGLLPQLIFFTGDAAFGNYDSGQGSTLTEQYQDIETFLSEVRQAFTVEIPKTNLFLVPGNHDVDRSEATEALTTWIEQQSNPDKITQLIQGGKKEWKQYMDRLILYRQFLQDHDYNHLLNDPERLIYAEVRKINGVKIGIGGFNSAWNCSRDREKGKLWLGGDWQNGTIVNSLKKQKTDLNLALIHHPPGWFVEQEDSKMRNQMERDFDFFLHGHEHQGWVNASAAGHVRIAAAACYERADKENGYNFVRLNLETSEAEIWLRRFDGDGGGWTPRIIANKTSNDGLWLLKDIHSLKKFKKSASPRYVPKNPEFCAKVGHDVHNDRGYAMQDQPWVVQVTSDEGYPLGTGFFVSERLIVTCYRNIEVEQKNSKTNKMEMVPRKSLNIRSILGSSFNDPVPARFDKSYSQNSKKFDVGIYELVNPIPGFSSVAPLAFSSGCKDNPIRLSGFPFQYECATGKVIDILLHNENRTRLQIHIKDSPRDINDVRMRGAPIFDIKKRRVIGMYISYDAQTSTASAISVEDIYHASEDSLPIRQPPSIEQYLTALARACEVPPYLSLPQDQPLSNIYVVQDVTAQRNSSEFEMSNSPNNIPQTLRIDQVIDDFDKALVIGSAGAGKSTLLQNLVQSQLIKGMDNNGLFFRLRGLKSRLPILVSLRGISEQQGDFQTAFRKQIEYELGKRLKGELPPDFIEDWQQQAGVDWLILLDGLDEIAREEKRRSVAGELRELPWPKQSKIVITTRPLDSSLQQEFENFYLLPFGKEQIREFSQRWFSGDLSRAKQFENEVALVRLGPLKGTPLAITILAKLFQGPKTLSSMGRAELYERYLEKVFSEEETSKKPVRKQYCEVMGSEYGDRIFNLRREVVEEIAQALHEESSVNDCISEYLKENRMARSTYDAERWCLTVLDLVSRNTSLFNKRVAGFTFEHLTFREYLCASAIVRKTDSDEQEIWDKAVSKWSDTHWKEVSLFILGILSTREQTKNVAGALVRRILKLGEAAFFFVIECMADRVFIEKDESEAVFSELDKQIAEAHLENGPIRFRYIYEAIIDSIQERRVAEAVQKIALDSQLDRDSRIEAARTLSEHGLTSLAATVWVGLIMDQELTKIWYRTFTPHNISQTPRLEQNPHPPPWWHDGVVALRENQSADALLELAIDCSCPIPVRLACGAALEKIGQKELAGAAWLSLAQDNNIFIWWRNDAVNELARLNKLEDLRMMVKRSDIPDEFRSFVIKVIDEEE